MRIGPFIIIRARNNRLTSEARTMLHPEYKNLIEHAVTIKGVELYTFKNLEDMNVKRWQRLNEFLREVELRMTKKELNEYLEMVEIICNQPEVKIVEIIKLTQAIRAATDLFLETETMYRLASIVYFTKDEDLTDYDFDWGEEKIRMFKTEPIGDFFLSNPMKKLLPQSDISASALRTFSKLTEAKLLLLSQLKSRYFTTSKTDLENSGGQSPTLTQ